MLARFNVPTAQQQLCHHQYYHHSCIHRSHEHAACSGLTPCASGLHLSWALSSLIVPRRFYLDDDQFLSLCMFIQRVYQFTIETWQIL